MQRWNKKERDNLRIETRKLNFMMTSTGLLPSDDLDESAVMQDARFGIEHARVGCAGEIRRHTVVLRVSQHAAQISVWRFFHHLLHRFVGYRCVNSAAVSCNIRHVCGVVHKVTVTHSALYLRASNLDSHSSMFAPSKLHCSLYARDSVHFIVNETKVRRILRVSGVTVNSWRVCIRQLPERHVA